MTGPGGGSDGGGTGPGRALLTDRPSLDDLTAELRDRTDEWVRAVQRAMASLRAPRPARQGRGGSG